MSPKIYPFDDDEDDEETSEDEEDEEDSIVIDDAEDVDSYLKSSNKKKGKKMPKEQPMTADDYFDVYPQDRRSKEEINKLLEKNKDCLKKLCGNSNRSEKQKALLVAVHVDFANRVSRLV